MRTLTNFFVLLLVESVVLAQSATLYWNSPTQVISGTPYAITLYTTTSGVIVSITNVNDGTSRTNDSDNITWSNIAYTYDAANPSANAKIYNGYYKFGASGTPTQGSTRVVVIISPVGLALPSPIEVTSNGVEVFWKSPYSPNPDTILLAGYDVSFGDEHQILGSTSASGNRFPLTDASLTPGQQYKISIRAKAGPSTAYVYSAWTDITTTIGDSTAPSQPTDLTKDAFSSSSYTISWIPSTDNAGVVEYEILHNGIVVGKIRPTGAARESFTLMNLPTGFAYNVTIRAKDGAGNYSPVSGFILVSGDASIVTLPPDVTPSTITASLPGSSTSQAALASVESAASNKIIIGVIPGEFSVDNKGSGNYGMSLPIAPGRGGPEPKITVSYNSGAGNGIMGVGFSLGTGLPQAITRGRSILARDGEVRGVAFDANDKFYLDGKRLLLVSSTSSEDVFCTEVEAFLKIKAYKSNGNIDSFEAVDKNGTKFIFGKYASTEDAYQIGGGEPTSAPRLAYAYALKRVEDVMGNYVNFLYGNPADGEYVISQIDYAGIGAGPAAASVCFKYDIREDKPRTFLAGRYFEHSQRLAAIAATSAVNGTQIPVSGLVFNYDYTDINGIQGRSRLKKATLVLANPTTRALSACQPTDFEWLTGSESLVSPAQQPSTVGMRSDNLQWGDFTGEGKDTLAAGISDPNRDCLYTGDLDGDGKTDRIVIGVYGDGTTFINVNIWSGVAESTVTAVKNYLEDGSPTHEARLAEGKAVYSRITFSDYDGDGRADMLVHGFDGYLHLFKSLGTGFSAPITSAYGVGGSISSVQLPDIMGMLLSRYYAQNIYAYLGLNIWCINYHEFVRPMPCDLNGDGMTDYVFAARLKDIYMSSGYWSQQYVMAVLAKQDGTFSAPISVNGFPPYSAGGFWSDSKLNLEDVFSGVMPGDFNGDGLTDFLVIDNKGNLSDPNLRGIMGYRWLLYLSKGQDAFGKPAFEMSIAPIPNTVSIGQQSISTYFNPVKQADWTNGLASPHYFLENAQQWASAFSAIETGAGSLNCFAFDVNRDGLSDYVWYVDRTASDGTAGNPGWYALISTGRFTSATSPTVGGTGFAGPVRLNYFNNLSDIAPLDMDISKRYVKTVKINHSLDYDGDGRQDYHIQTLYNGMPGVPGVNASYSGNCGTVYLSDGPLESLLTEITNGFGSKTKITYLAAKDPTIYTKGVSPSQVYPIREIMASTPVVAEVYKDSGTNNDSERAHFSYQYSGNRLDLSGRGSLGFHSFVTIDRQTNIFKYQFLAQSFPMTGLTTREQTYRYWMDGSTCKFRLISSHDNTVVFDEVKQGSVVPGSVYPFISKAIESRWEDGSVEHFTLTASGAQSQAESVFAQTLPTGAHISISAESLFDSQTTPLVSLPGIFSPSDTTASGSSSVIGYASFSSFDSLSFPQSISYGNLTKLMTNYGGGHTETVLSSYYPPGSNGEFPSLVSSVRTFASNSTYGEKEAPEKRFEYWKRNGSVQTSFIEKESIVTSNENYNSYKKYYREADSGHILRTELVASGCGSYDISSTDSTQFDARFDLPTQRKDAYSNPFLTSYHEWLGKPASSTDVNGVVTSNTYDELGRVTLARTTISDLTLDKRTLWSFTPTGGGGWSQQCTVSLPSGISMPALPNGCTVLSLTSAFAIRTEEDGKPPVTVYYDRLARAIRTIKEGYNGQKTVVDTVYTNWGQAVATSLPYLEGTACNNWNFMGYDQLGRVVKVQAPNGTLTTTDYIGRVTRVTVKATDREDQINVTEVNAKGQTVKVWNANNVPGSGNIATTGVTGVTPSITFALDGFGRMRSTTLLGGAGYPITADYDPLGKQKELNDPDKGSWIYVNDSLGRLRQQTDANGTVTLTNYDKLDRPVSRTTTQNGGEVETTNWYYYAAQAESGVNQVLKGPKGWILAPHREETITTGLTAYAMPKTVSAHYYDGKGRIQSELSLIDSKWFYSFAEYDSRSRIKKLNYSWRAPGQEDASVQPYSWNECGFVYTYDGTDKGYITKIEDTTGAVWWEGGAQAYDYMDRPKTFTKGNSYETTRTYDQITGLLLNITTKTPSGSSILQNLSYTYDGLGNLISRKNSNNPGGILEEVYTYDVLNRLNNRSMNGSTTSMAAYADNGNILQRPDMISQYGYSGSQFVYGTAADANKLPHAVREGLGFTMTYDANGNLLSRIGNGMNSQVRWTGFDKPRYLTNGSKGSEFHYNANRSRVLHLEFDQVDANGRPNNYVKKKYYALGSSMEVDYGRTGGVSRMDAVRLYVPGPDGISGTVEWKNNDSGTLQSERYVYHYDHLGSIDAITTHGVVQVPAAYTKDKENKDCAYSYTAWGNRRNPLTWTGAPSSTAQGGQTDRTPRGYTGHEMLDDLGLVHMNGRIYDPLLGRFLSADLFVQSPKDLQVFNRYSYVRNNPLTMTDPSGFVFGDEAPATARAQEIEGAGGIMNYYAARREGFAQASKIGVASTAGLAVAMPISMLAPTGGAVATVVAVVVDAVAGGAGATASTMTMNSLDHKPLMEGTKSSFKWGAIFGGAFSTAARMVSAIRGAMAAPKVEPMPQVPAAAPTVEANAGSAGGAAPTATPAQISQASALRDDLSDVIKVTGLRTPGGSMPPTVVGAVNNETGTIGAGATLGGRNTGGVCSEDFAVRAVGAEPAADAPVTITPAIRPRTGETIPVCPGCETQYGRERFAPEATFRTDQPST